MRFRTERVLGEDGARAWHGIDEVSIPVDHPGLVADPLQEIVAQLPEGFPSNRVELYLGFDGDELAANGVLHFPMLVNQHMAEVSVSVAPDQRRRGYGRAMFGAMKERVQAFGRRLVIGSVGAPFEVVAPGTRLAESVGAKLAQKQLRSELRLASIDRPTLAKLKQDARSHSVEYEIA